MWTRIGKLVFDVLVAAGAVACVLVWMEVKPKDVRMTTWPHWLWLIGALILFAISLGSSLRSLYLSNKRVNAKIASINQANAEQVARINKGHEADLYRSHQIRDEITAELQKMKAAQPKPLQYPVPHLRMKIVETVSALQGFLGEHGNEPKVTKLIGESTKDTALRYFKEGDPWRAKFIGDYRLRFGDSIPKLRDEMRVRTSISDNELNEAIETAANNEGGSYMAVKGIIDRLWTLGRNVNA
jgi:hypothetical protein